MLETARKRFAHSSLARPLAALLGGTALGQALIAATTPIVSRIYTKADLGVLGLFVSFLSFASLVVTARYEYAIPGARDDDEADDYLALVLGLGVPLSFLCAFGLWFMRETDTLGFAAIPLWTVVVAPIALTTAGWFSALRLWYVRARRFREIGRVLVVQSAGRATIPVVLGMMVAGPLGLIVGEVVGRLAGVGRLVRNVDGSRVWRALRDGRARAVAVRSWKYPVILLPSGLMDAAALTLPVPLIAEHFGLATAGAFLMVQRLTTIPAALISVGAGDVFHLEYVKAHMGGPEMARRAVDRAGLKLLMFAVLVYVPAMAVAPALLPRILGPTWGDAGLMFLAVAPWSMANLVVSPLGRVIAVSRRKELKLVYDVVAMVLLIGTILAGADAGRSLLWTIAMTSGGQIVAYALYFVLIRRACSEITTGEETTEEETAAVETSRL